MSSTEQQKICESAEDIHNHNKGIFHIGQCPHCYQSNVINPSSPAPKEVQGELEALALSKYSTPYGQPNPQYYAFIDGYNIAASRHPAPAGMQENIIGLWVNAGTRFPKSDRPSSLSMVKLRDANNELLIEGKIQYLEDGIQLSLPDKFLVYYHKDIEWLDENVKEHSAGEDKKCACGTVLLDNDPYQGYCEYCGQAT